MFLVTFSLALMAYEARADEELVFIKISATGEPVKDLTLSPAEAVIGKGTIVYWVNAAPAEVSVVFAEGKRCEDVTAMSDRFKPSFEACYLTDFLQRYDTSRLQFREVGTFNYQVKTEAGVTVDGKVVVK
jgi:plastocyanin